MGDIPNPKEIIDELRVAEAQRRAEICARYVTAARQRMADEFARGSAARDLVEGLSDAMDRLLRLLFDLAGLPPKTYVSLVALGGYGRREMFPHSDLDLLLVCDDVPEALVSSLMDTMLYPLWDARLRVGHAVRGQGETLDLAEQDLTVATALLDARHVAGDPGPFFALQAAANRRFFGPNVGRFVARLRRERAERHRRFGETVFRLEPNVKSGKGGLRDLNTGLWAARARVDIEQFDELPAADAASARQSARLVQAQDFLRHLRLAMHIRAGRAQDRLVFELQQGLAPQMFPDDPLPGHRRRRATPMVESVERLMHAYYRHARAVVAETDGLLDRMLLVGREGPLLSRPVSDRVDEHLVDTEEGIDSRDPEQFWNEPSQLLRTFEVARRMDRRLSLPLRDVVSEAAAGMPGFQLQVDPEAARRFFRLLCTPKVAGSNVNYLESLHNLGLLGAMIPEFSHCAGHVQHDLYHVYTVDRHSLFVVEQLWAWARGDRAYNGKEDDPVMAKPAQVMSGVDGQRVLYLAALLHDVAKPMGSGHCARGSALAAGVAARLGMSGVEVDQLRFLVGEHLTMAKVSQRRDLNDPSVIKAFCRKIRGVEDLRRLYLLTAADTAMTAPGNLTGWKGRLLAQLFDAALVHLAQGTPAPSPTRSALQRRRHQLERAAKPLHAPHGLAMARRMPEEMLTAHSTDDLVRCLTPAVRRGLKGPGSLGVSSRRLPSGETELIVCCDDAGGLLATIAGVMVSLGIEVLSAQIYTLKPDPETGEPGPALDIFTVAFPPHSGADRSERFQQFRDRLAEALCGELELERLVARATRTSSLAERVVPPVPTAVQVRDDVSPRFSVVEVRAPDRPGVLYAITRALSAADADIRLSKVSSEAGRVVDIFYVSDRRGGGKLAAQRRQQVHDAVRGALEIGADRPLADE